MVLLIQHHYLGTVNRINFVLLHYWMAFNNYRVRFPELFNATLCL